MPQPIRPILLLLLLPIAIAHAQQYGWVRVADLGNQSTSLSAVDFVDSLHGCTSGGSTTTYRTNDGGTSWTPCVVNAPLLVSSLSMLNAQVGWCVGNQGTTGRILRTSDGGANWFQQFFHLDRNYLGTATQSLSRNTTAGSTRNFSPDTGKVVQTTNGGTAWTERTIAPTIRQLRKVQFIDSLHGWITVFGPGGVLRTNNGGQSWVQVSTTPLFTAISFIDTLNGWGIGTKTVFRTTDAGTSWIVLANVGTEFDDFGSTALSFVDNLRGWAFGQIFYQGDLAGAIYSTTDGGLSWSQDLAGAGTRHMNDGKMLDRYHGWAVGDFGSVFAYRIMSTVPERLDRIPRSFELEQNYPNPFNPTTTMEYEILIHTFVSIKIFDIQGKEMGTLVKAEHDPGVYRVQFDARALASGIYYYTMTAGSFTQTKQMIFVK